MSLSLVRTCDKCGVRSEKRLQGFDDAMIAIAAIQFIVMNPKGGMGCPDCCPEVREAQALEDREDWDASVARAYSHGSRRSS